MIEGSQEFFANEMERHGYGRRTWQLAGINKINVDHEESFYRDDFWSYEGERHNFCKDHSLPNFKSEPLVEEIEKMTDALSNWGETRVYFIGFKLNCVAAKIVWNQNILIAEKSSTPEGLAKLLSHEIGHVFWLSHTDHKNNIMNPIIHPQIHYKLLPNQAQNIIQLSQ